VLKRLCRDKHSSLFLGCVRAEEKGSFITPTKGSKPSTVLYGESEELNKVVILTLARAIHVNGLEQQTAPWIKEILGNIMTKTPHSWPKHTLNNFPAIFKEFYEENPGRDSLRKLFYAATLLGCAILTIDMRVSGSLSTKFKMHRCDRKIYIHKSRLM
jgi:hypothetical protein